MGVLNNNDFYTADTNPTSDVNPKTIGAVWINYKTGTQFTCSDNTKNKNIWKSNWESIYPIGSLFITVSDIDPNVHFGGKWRKETGEKTIWLSSSGAGNYISPGLPNIRGAFNCITSQTHYGSWDTGSTEGAFGVINATQCFLQGSGRPPASPKSRLSFDASKSSGIYGNSTTVQPKAIRVYCWIRES